MTQKNTTKFTLPSDREIVMTRVFDARRELVFKAITDPNLIPKWWGPAVLTTTVDQMDVQKGGIWRFVQHDPEGNEFAFNGVYLAVIPPELIQDTFEFEGMPGHIIMETMVLEELDNRTKLTVTSLFETVEDRDGILESGMEAGAIESWDRFAEILEKEKLI
jgi:uncharacterized protein YndB with AHSA1/START domain